MTKMYKLLKHFTRGKRDVSANIFDDSKIILKDDRSDISSNYECDDVCDNIGCDNIGCDNKCENCNGCSGRDGKNGRDGRDGRDGMNGTNGRDGRDCCENNGTAGPTGPQGSQGSQGSEGPTGPVGQNAAISSIFVWSAILQPNITPTKKKNETNFL